MKYLAMQINLESADQQAVQAYSENKIQINSIIYESSLIVSREEIISNLAIKKIQEMDQNYRVLIIKTKPELIILRDDALGASLPVSTLSQVSEMRISIVCM